MEKEKTEDQINSQTEDITTKEEKIETELEAEQENKEDQSPESG